MILKRVNEKIAIQRFILERIEDGCLWGFDVRALLLQAVAFEKPNKELQEMRCWEGSYIHSILLDVGGGGLQNNQILALQ